MELHIEGSVKKFMEQYSVTGMSCAACSARVEKAVSGVQGVTSCSVSLLTHSMGVEGSASPDAIVAAVQNAGYDAALKNKGKEESAGTLSEEEALKDRETPVLPRHRCVVGQRPGSDRQRHGQRSGDGGLS